MVNKSMVSRSQEDGPSKNETTDDGPSVAATAAAAAANDVDDDNNPSSSINTSTTTKTTTTATTNEKKNKSFNLVRYLSDNHNWDSYDDDQERFIQELPKIELHVHLDGSFDPDFLWRYMQTMRHHHDDSASFLQCLPCESYLPWDGSTLPVRKLVENCKSSRDFHKLCTCRGHQSLQAMLQCFEIFLPLVRRNLVLLEQLAYDFCQRQWEQNVVYTEVRYSPFLLADGFGGGGGGGKGDGGDDTTSRPSNTNSNDSTDDCNDDDDDNDDNVIDGEAVLKAVTTGLRRGCHKFGITVNQILCAITWRPDWAQPTLDLVKLHLHDYPCATVGIDIAAGEEHFDEQQYPEMHRIHYNVFQKAQTLPEYSSIPITIHAGESPADSSYENVRRAINEYGAVRIGHGYRAVRDKSLMDELRQKHIHLEVCPTSSYETGGWVLPSSPPPPEVKEGEHGSGGNGVEQYKNWMEHPIVEMDEAGLRFSFSSDDPAVFHTSLAWQYRVAMAKMDFSRQRMLQCNLDAIDAAFCSNDEKQKLRQHVLDFAAFLGLEYVVDGSGRRNQGGVDTDSALDDDDNVSEETIPPPCPTWRRTSSCASNTNSSIHRPLHSIDGTPPPVQWKRSMSANFVDRVYVYKPGQDDEAEYL